MEMKAEEVNVRAKAKQIFEEARKYSVAEVPPISTLLFQIHKMMKPIALRHFTIFIYKDGIYLFGSNILRFLGDKEFIIERLEQGG